MSKMMFGVPIVAGLATASPDVHGPGSGGSTTDLNEPYSYDRFRILILAYPSLLNQYDTNPANGVIDWDEYVSWWTSHSDWNETLFIEMNGRRYDGTTP